MSGDKLQHRHRVVRLRAEFRRKDIAGFSGAGRETDGDDEVLAAAGLIDDLSDLLNAVRRIETDPVLFGGGADGRAALGGVVEELPRRLAEDVVDQFDLVKRSDVEIGDAGSKERFQNIGM